MELKPPSKSRLSAILMSCLLDIGMPKLDGYEVARRIRAEPWGKNTPCSSR